MGIRMAVLTALRSFSAGLRRSWPLRLDVGGVWFTFAAEQDLNNFLMSRIEVPAPAIEELASLEARAMQRELRHTRRSHQNAVDILVRAMETGTKLRHLWGILDVSKVPDELDWPAVLFAIGNADNISDSALRSALTNYIHYLESRREILDSISREGRRIERKNGAGPVVPDAMRPGSHTNSHFNTRRNVTYARLPRRRAVNVDLNTNSRVTVYMARNRFLLNLAGDEAMLVEDNGTRHPLKIGRNTVGRSAECDVRVSSSQSDVSRQHLLIELTDGHHLRLTDLSSRGTYLSPELLERMDTGTTSRHMH